MRSSRLLLIASVFSVGALLLLSASASATVVTVSGTTVFSDDFESLGTSVSHAAYQDTSGLYTPSPSVGTWTLIGNDTSGLST
jgi:hypothetical protein